MKAKRLTTILIIALFAVFILAVCLVPNKVTVSADTEIIAEEPTEEPAQEEQPEEDKELVTLDDSVIEYLKSVYGDNYQKYYDQLIEKWGSIEEYLLHASESLPEEYKYKAQELINNTTALYVSVGANLILLIGAVLIALKSAKKNKNIEEALKKCGAAFNQIDVAMVALLKNAANQGEAWAALLQGEQFKTVTDSISENKAVLEKAVREVEENV